MRSLSSLVAVCIVVFTAPLLAQSDTCLSHIQESGSIFTGKIIESYQEFSGIDKETALRRLEALLPDAAGVTIASVDAEAGTIKGERRDPLLSHPFPIAFTVSSTPSGVRVQLWLRTLPGQIPVGRFKHGICDSLKVVAVEPPAQASPATPQETTNTEGSVAEKTTPPDGDDTDKPLSMEAIEKATSSESSGDQKADKDAGSSHKKKPQKALTNEDVIKLVKAEMGDKVIIDKINASPGDKLDTSTDALIRLKKAGVSKAIIDAMIKRGEGE
ncbi:MAG TPA: hypothetical protein VF713_03700 [Thermoanaerobaculia bacterium]